MDYKDFKELLQKIDIIRYNTKLPQKREKYEQSKQDLINSKAEKLNFNNLPQQKGFFGHKIEKFITFSLLNGSLLTKDFGSSDINKTFLEDFIRSGHLIDAHLQIKASKTNSFGTADLFHFLKSSNLNMLLIRYEPNTQNRTFKITKVYIVKLNLSFFIHIVSSNLKFFKYMSNQKNLFKKDAHTFNKKKNKMTIKWKHFSYSKKGTRIVGNLNLIPLIKFLKNNKAHGEIHEIKITNNSFSLCGVVIEPLEFLY